LKSSIQRTIEGPGPLKYAFVRNGLRFFTRCYVRVRTEGGKHLPDEPYLICFSHPGWLDPILIVGFMPEKRMIFIFGPREEDMLLGAKNRLIRWARLGVPFKPSKQDLLETTRRAVAVLKAGHCLAVAGEGRLSDREGAILPLQDGAAFLALRARVPAVPVAVIGTRWLRFGKTMRLRIGRPVWPAGRRADRAGVNAVTDELQAALEKLLEGVDEEPPPGPIGRWLTDVFNERPWLEERQAAGAAGGDPVSARPPNGAL
jgi:1-acyl-sn-glycerol-3-phosphate acyltransferase